MPKVRAAGRLALLIVTAIAVPSTSAADSPPVLIVSSPLQDTVARPYLHVVARCEDDDAKGCQQIAARSVSTACGVSQASLIVPGSTLDAYLGTCGDVEITATDRSGQVVTVRRRIVVESTPTIVEVESVGGAILDVSSDRILFLEETAADAGVLKVHDRTSGVDTTVTLPAAAATLSTMSFAYLTPHGVVYQYDPALAITPRINGSRTYEWRDGSLVAFPFSQWGSLSVNGGLAAWRGEHGNTWTGSEYIIFIRDLAAGTTVEASLPATSTVWPSVGANGDVVFTTPRTGSLTEADLARYRAGATTRLTTAGPSLKQPVTDGANIVAAFGSPFSSDIVLIGAGQESLASGITRGFPTMYAVGGGWTAFIAAAGAADARVWLRAPDGTRTEVPAAAPGDSLPVAVAPNGEVMLTNGTGLYRASSTFGPSRVGASVLKPWFVDGRWYFTAGRTLFTSMLNPCTTTVEPASLTFN